MTLPTAARCNRFTEAGALTHWDTRALHDCLTDQNPGETTSLRSTERLLQQSALLPETAQLSDLKDEFGRPARQVVAASFDEQARSRRQQSLIVQRAPGGSGPEVLFANDGRGGRRWLFLDKATYPAHEWLELLQALVGERPAILWPLGSLVSVFRSLVREAGTHDLVLPRGTPARFGNDGLSRSEPVRATGVAEHRHQPTAVLTHLDRLEAESMHILREVMALAENPVMLYSVGKDSAVMLHLARKAFAPSPPPFR